MIAFSKKYPFFNFPSLQEEIKRVYYVMKADEVLLNSEGYWEVYIHGSRKGERKSSSIRST
jgi:hypothetical protein